MTDEPLLQVVTVFLVAEWLLLLVLMPPVALAAAGVWLVGKVRAHV